MFVEGELFTFPSAAPKYFGAYEQQYILNNNNSNQLSCAPKKWAFSIWTFNLLEKYLRPVVNLLCALAYGINKLKWKEAMAGS